jgi:SAM-dependent methyltransferase/Flp pilus assembly protein TadD
MENLSRQQQQASDLWQTAEKLLSEGKPKRAKPILFKLVKMMPDEPALLYNLGTCCLELEQFDQAITYLQNALNIDPGIVEANVVLGRALKSSGKTKAAIDCFYRYLEFEPKNLLVTNMLADCLHQTGQQSEFIKVLLWVGEQNPEDFEVQFDIADTLYRYGDVENAVEHFKRTIELAPNNLSVCQKFADILGKITLQRRDSQLLEIVNNLLGNPAIESHYLIRVALDLLSFEPSVSAAINSIDQFKDRPATEVFNDPDLLTLLSTPIFKKILIRGLICTEDFEKISTIIRSAYLLAIDAGEDIEHFDTLCALAIQCQYSEFIYQEAASETGIIESLRQNIERISVEDFTDQELTPLIVYSAYRSPKTLSNFDDLIKIESEIESEFFSKWFKQSILDLREETNILETITILTPIDDPVSNEVRKQYDENPYPRWFDAPNVEPHTPAQMLQELFPHFVPSKTLEVGCPILIAGCGSGWHAALIAALYPDSKITAIDLSRINLAYAIRRTKELNIANIEFAQADILALGSLSVTFPYLESVGVLHHLSNPLAGWKTLTELTQVNGIMHIGLYSKLAREKLDDAAKLVDIGNYAANSDDIRRFRNEVFAIESKSENIQQLVRNREFYAMSSCRDLLFHAQEHRFSISQIQESLAELNLEFIGFQLYSVNSANLYLELFPDDRDMSNLDNWHHFEQAHPETFNGMYDFYCRKKK